MHGRGRAGGEGKGQQQRFPAFEEGGRLRGGAALCAAARTPDEAQEGEGPRNVRGCPGRSFPVCRAGPSLTQAGRRFSVPPCLWTGIESGAPSGLDGGPGLRTAPRRAPPFRRVLDPYACGSKRRTEKAREICAAVRGLLPGLQRGAVVDSGGTGFFRAAVPLFFSCPHFLIGIMNSWR